MVNVFEAGGALGTALAAGGTRSLGEVASKFTVAKPPPFPISDLRLETEILALIDEAVSRLRLWIEEAKVEHELGQDVPYHRLSSRIGLAALIQVPEGWLSGPDQVWQVSQIGNLLRGQVAAVYVLTLATAVDATFTYKVWPFWESKFFQKVRAFDRQFVAALGEQSPEERTRTLRTNLDLEEKPPKAVQLTTSEVDTIVAIMSRKALAVADPQGFLRDLVNRIGLEDAAHSQAVGLLGPDPGVTARALVGWAAGQSFPPADERAASYTVIGYLLEAVGKGGVPEDWVVLAGIVERYGLIRDRAAVARLRAGGN